MRRLHRLFLNFFGNPSNLLLIPIHRFGTKFSYYTIKSYSSPPETVNIYPTFKCNLRCKMCFERYARVEYEMDIGDWQWIIKELKNFHPRIHISGGEPFLYPDIIKIIEQIKRLGLFLHITTNGTYLEDHKDEIINFKVDRIEVSIDGPEEVHDSIRGVRGTFQKLLKGLKRLKRKKGNRHLPLIKINSIINFENPEKMEEILNIGLEYGVNIVQFIYPLFLDGASIKNHQKFLKEHLSRNLNYWRKANQFKPVASDFYRINKILNKLKRYHNPTIDIFPKFNAEEFNSYYTSPSGFIKIYKGRCQAMWHTATILPDGYVESCPDYIIGNIKRERFLKMWNNKIMVDLRRRIKGGEFFSVCPACCFFYQ